jgi:hypothetical protein
MNALVAVLVVNLIVMLIAAALALHITTQYEIG